MISIFNTKWKKKYLGEKSKDNILCKLFDHYLEIGLFDDGYVYPHDAVFCTRCDYKVWEIDTDPLIYAKLQLKCHNIDKKSFMQRFKEEFQNESMELE